MKRSHMNPSDPESPGIGQKLVLDLTWQEPIPAAGVEAVLALLGSGKLHRYGETGGKPGEASALESEFAQQLGVRYCVAMNSCGSAMFVALKAAGVKPGDLVLSNCFTLAPVPGSIAHANAKPVLVDVTDDYTIDLEDLDRKASASGAKTLLLSHMRGHICDMDSLSAICRRHGVQVIEDCAHTMGADWRGKATGTWGRAGCFSLQSYKHANSGEGGLLVTDDADIAAQAILLSGSYMLYGAHLARPSDDVFERWKYTTPNFSLRMSNLAAATARPQLGDVLADRCRRWNQRYAWMAAGLAGVDHLRLPNRPADEHFVGSSIQFSVVDLVSSSIQPFLDRCAKRGVHIKWFGAEGPVGFTSVWQHWRFFGEPQSLPNADRVLGGLCDMRLPLSLSQQDCELIASTIRTELQAALPAASH
jgi:dTDP-4-amino-4,6-dideoxygalactose transaminase